MSPNTDEAAETQAGHKASWDAISIEAFVLIDKRIDTREEDAANSLRESIRNRWEFGKLMLAERKGKQLPKGMLDELVSAIGKSRSELQYRMQFAERYPTEDEMFTALDTFTSWTQVKRKLPKPPPPPQKKPNTPSVPTPNKRNETVEGKADAPVDVPVVIDWDSLPPKVKDREAVMRRVIRKEQEKEFRTRLLAELDQYRAKLDADFATHKAAYDAQNARNEAQDARIRVMRDEERRRYQEGIEVYRAKGLITPDDYNQIRSCLHPDSRKSVSDEKLANAFRLFNDSRIKTLLVKEPPRPTNAPPLPATAEDLLKHRDLKRYKDHLKRQAAAAAKEAAAAAEREDQ